MSDNLALWDELSRTDPKATKPFQRSGFRGTQIDPVWRYKRMTEKFGPIGDGWGYELTRDPIIADGLAFVCVRVWYRVNYSDPFYTGEQWGGDVLFKPRKEGQPVPNDEALKMATTDAVGKALVLLGLGADVHMGQFDDSKYRAEVDAEYRAKENGKAEQATKDYEFGLAEKLVKCASLEALDTLWREEGAKVRAFTGDDYKRLVKMFSDRKAEINGMNEHTALGAA